jgi:RHS repeat-associated protein
LSELELISTANTANLYFEYDETGKPLRMEYGGGYYDPVTSRYINADSELADVGGEILGCNLFAYCFNNPNAYCQNNPINMTDETGHWPRWITAVVAIAAAVVAIVAAPAVAAVATVVAVVATVALVVQTVHYDARKAANSNLPATPEAATAAGWKNSKPYDAQWISYE